MNLRPLECSESNRGPIRGGGPLSTGSDGRVGASGEVRLCRYDYSKSGVLHM